MLLPDSPFWRSAPFTAAEMRLIAALFTAHELAAQRQNISTVAVLGAAQGSGSYPNSIAAALLTLGSVHGCVEAAHRTLRSISTTRELREVSDAIDRGLKIPGWGSSFQQGEPEPAWNHVSDLLAEMAPLMMGRAALVTGVFLSKGKRVFVNPAGYTAATAIVLGMPAEISPWLFVAARLCVWSELFVKSNTDGQLWITP